WLSALPEKAVKSSPALCVALGLMELHLGHLEAVDRLIDHAEHGFDQGQAPLDVEVPTDGGMVREVPAALAMLRSELASARGAPAPPAVLRAALPGAGGRQDPRSQYATSALPLMAEDERGPRLWSRWL